MLWNRPDIFIDAINGKYVLVVLRERRAEHDATPVEFHIAVRGQEVAVGELVVAGLLRFGRVRVEAPEEQARDQQGPGRVAPEC